MYDDMRQKTVSGPSLPIEAYLPINRCTLPAAILGGLTYQHHPVALLIDGVAELHHRLFRQLDRLDSAQTRATYFIDYMSVHFLLEQPELAGYTPSQTNSRLRADYRRLLQGWMFDSDSREGAVLKGWVESRFGLLPRWHKGVIRNAEAEAYAVYLHERTAGIYNTNSLEAQLDLLYAYCQYELAQRQAIDIPLRLYRGYNRLAEQDIFPVEAGATRFVVMNNLNSFSSELERADEFGDHVLECLTPAPKILYFQNLLPGISKGENEYVVIGGLYEVRQLF